MLQQTTSNDRRKAARHNSHSVRLPHETASLIPLCSRALICPGTPLRRPSAAAARRLVTAGCEAAQWLRRPPALQDPPRGRWARPGHGANKHEDEGGWGKQRPTKGWTRDWVVFTCTYICKRPSKGFSCGLRGEQRLLPTCISHDKPPPWLHSIARQLRHVAFIVKSFQS